MRRHLRLGPAVDDHGVGRAHPARGARDVERRVAAAEHHHAAAHERRVAALLEPAQQADRVEAVTPALALRVARFAGMPMDELLAGQWLSPRVCPHCGYPPDDFVDEDTIAG